MDGVTLMKKLGKIVSTVLILLIALVLVLALIFRGTALLVSSRFGLLIPVKALLWLGTDPNFEWSPGLTPLRLACVGGNTDVAEELLKHGADPGRQDESGASPLIFSVSLRDDQAVALLMKFKAPVNATTNEDLSPLAYACLRAPKGAFKIERLSGPRNPRVIQLLLDNGADVNHQTKASGVTPLMLACGVGPGGKPATEEVIAMLLKAGADVTMTDRRGDTALTIAKRKRASQALLELLEHGTVPARKKGGKQENN